MWRSLLLSLLVLGGMANGAEWQVVSSDPVVSLGHGASFLCKKVKGPLEVGLQLVVFDSTRVKLEVVAQEARQGAVMLDRLLSPGMALAGCNGGYFSPDTFAPAGLQVVNGQRTGQYLPFGVWGGGFGTRKGRPGIYPEAEILADSDFDCFLQCSPILVDGGRLFAGEGEDVRARRTFIAHDGGTGWALGVATRIGLRELASLLVSKPEMVTGFAVRRALNLDGGPSTALWCRDAQKKVVYEKEWWPVKNAIFIRPLP